MTPENPAPTERLNYEKHEADCTDSREQPASARCLVNSASDVLVREALYPVDLAGVVVKDEVERGKRDEPIEACCNRPVHGRYALPHGDERDHVAGDHEPDEEVRIDSDPCDSAVHEPGAETVGLDRPDEEIGNDDGKEHRERVLAYLLRPADTHHVRRKQQPRAEADQP